MDSIGNKAHKYFSRIFNKYAPKVESYTENVGKTVADIPSILRQKAYTAGPKILDGVNDYLFKPVAGNLTDLTLGTNIATKENYIDKIANKARASDKKFYKTHAFHQKANHKYGDLLGDVVTAAIPINVTSKAKAGTAVISKVAPKAKVVAEGAIETAKHLGDDILTKGQSYVQKTRDAITKLIGKDRKIKKKLDELKKLKKTIAKQKDLTPEELSKLESYIINETQKIKDMKSKSFIDLYRKSRDTRKIDKTIQGIINPDGALKKFGKGALKATAGGAAFGGAALYLSGDDEELNDNVNDNLKVQDVPGTNLDGDSNNENKTNETVLKNKKNKEDSKTSKGNKGNSNTKKYSNTGGNISKKNNTSTKKSSTAERSGTIMDNKGNSYSIFLQGGSFKVKGPDGKTYILISGVNDSNKSQKFNIASNRSLPF